MSSDPSVSPDQPPTTSAAVPDSAPPPESAVKFTRAASLWTSLTAGFLILIVLLIFITQNTGSAALAFFGWHWTLPLGVAILLAAVGGGLITVAIALTWARVFPALVKVDRLQEITPEAEPAPRPGQELPQT